jgi:co-chaperonin GroES (HSP10)
VKIYPIGSRVFVREIAPIDEVTARAQAAGLHVVVLDENLPRPTSGEVTAIGSDPLIQELIQLGDIVFYSKFAGHEMVVEGRVYKSLELREIISVARPDPVTALPEELDTDAPES